MSGAGAWRFYVDRGGTFTDIVAESPDGALSSLKLLSQDARYDDAALEGIRRCLALPPNAPIPSERVAELRMGTTVATNALLERKGERVLLVTTPSAFAILAPSAMIAIVKATPGSSSDRPACSASRSNRK